MLPIQLCDDIADAGISGIWTGPGDPEAIPKAKGAYLLSLYLGMPEQIAYRRLGRGWLQPGWYVYLGSARGSGGLASRLQRHFRKSKKLHWHVDRLTVKAAAMTALAVPGGDECRLADQLLASGRFKIAHDGFGSSDCRQCKSHLLMPVVM